MVPLTEPTVIIVDMKTSAQNETGEKHVNDMALHSPSSEIAYHITALFIRQDALQ